MWDGHRRAGAEGFWALNKVGFDPTRGRDERDEIERFLSITNGYLGAYAVASHRG